MDNLTHTLAGVLAGETAARILPGHDSALPPPVRRGLYMALMVVGSNLPDLDFLYSGLSGSKLDYLLHHRGHTHTVVGAVATAALMFVIARAWLRWRRYEPTRTDLRQLAGIALTAPLLHLLMDFGNSYGVHPFWPLHNGWMYGDAIFIVEPLFWAAAAPLAILLRSVIARVLVALALVAGALLSFTTGMVPTSHAVMLVALTLALLAVAWRASPAVALSCSIGVWASIVAVFSAASHLAARNIDAFASVGMPPAETLDRVLTPMPVNPICWEVQLVQLEQEDYVVRRAMLSVAPAWLSAAECPGRALDVSTTAPLEPVTGADTPNLRWRGQMRMPREQIADLAANHCEAAAFLRFARVPWLRNDPDGWVIGDLRYDREPQLGFAELKLDRPPTACPGDVPPWIPPRDDLLRGPDDRPDDGTDRQELPLHPRS